MNCPVCGISLVMSERQGVEIDYCPQCRGVWLDRGGLDKIIVRSTQEMEAARSLPDARHRDDYYRDRQHEDWRDRHHDDHHDGHHRRKRSFWEDLFD